MAYMPNHLDMSVCIFMLGVDVAECYIIHNVLDEEGLLGQERRNVATWWRNASGLPFTKQIYTIILPLNILTSISVRFSFR